MSIQNICFQCGKNLIEVSKTQDGSLTTTIYKCSNTICQKEKDDKVNAARQKIKDRLKEKKLRFIS
jgi:hypothetical protein